MNHCKGKRKELSPQDAALLIQMNYRAHLAHRSQVLRCLRDLAVAKAKLKEIRSFFYNISYRRRVAHDTEERQRFAEKIIVLLLTVDALEVNSRSVPCYFVIQQMTTAVLFIVIYDFSHKNLSALSTMQCCLEF
jgi:hypothetical protein